MTNTTNTADLRATLIEARDWFESQAKAVSKGCGSSYELHDLRTQRDALDAALAAPAQAATAKQSPHPEYDKGFSDGWNRCEERQAAAPARAGEYPKLPEPAMFDAVDRQGNPVSHGYSASQVLALIDADRAARGQTLRLLTQEEMDSLGRRAEGMDGNEWDQWVQEKFAQVNGLKVQGGRYEWDWE